MITDRVIVSGSLPNRVILKDEESGDTFETIDEYVVSLVGRNPAVDNWGIEE